MKCPACDNVLTEMKAGEIMVDVCQDGCGGIWFDHFELQKMDEPHEHIGEELLNIKKKDGVTVDLEAKRSCPKCENIKMMQHFFSVNQKIAVDECGQCGGFWLDVGELAAIREMFNSEEERHKAADEYFSKLFDGPISEMKNKSDQDLAKAKKVSNLFRFVCPSYYIPGDQAGGAF